jgi:hypothetical protein
MGLSVSKCVAALSIAPLSSYKCDIGISSLVNLDQRGLPFQIGGRKLRHDMCVVSNLCSQYS